MIDVDDEDHPGDEEDGEDHRRHPLRPVGPEHVDGVRHHEQHAEQRERAPRHVDVALATMRRRVALRHASKGHRAVSGSHHEVALREAVRRGLGHGLHDDEVEVDVPRLLHGVHDDARDVLGHERLGHVVVHRIGPGAVPAESHERELVGPHHAGRHLDHAERLAVQLEPEHLGQRVRGELRRVVPAAARVGRVAGDRRDVHDVGDAALDGAPAQEGQQRARDPLQREHVHLEHPRPVLDGRVLDRVEALRAARVVHERVQRAGRGEVIAQGVHVRAGRSGRRRTRMPRSPRRAHGADPRGGRRRRRPIRRRGARARSPLRSRSSHRSRPLAAHPCAHCGAPPGECARNARPRHPHGRCG